MITLEGASRRFDGKWAVRDLSFRIEPGEVYGLVGPNGAGKTTAIKMLSGILSPSSGRVLIGDFDMALEPLRAKALIGYVPDRAFFYEKLTAREFMMFVASVHGVERAEGLARIESLIGTFGMGDYADDFIEGYSHGMRQRLSFASALLSNPRALLIDEPFVGLDPFGVRLIDGLMRDIASSGAAVLLATHSLHIAADICARVGFIKNGSLVEEKTRDEIKAEAGGLEGFFIKRLGG